MAFLFFLCVLEFIYRVIMDIQRSERIQSQHSYASKTQVFPYHLIGAFVTFSRPSSAVVICSSRPLSYFGFHPTWDRGGRSLPWVSEPVSASSCAAASASRHRPCTGAGTRRRGACRRLRRPRPSSQLAWELRRCRVCSHGGNPRRACRALCRRCRASSSSAKASRRARYVASSRVTAPGRRQRHLASRPRCRQCRPRRSCPE